MSSSPLAPAVQEPPNESPTRALVSAVFTLTLSILGSSLLPLPYAFSKTGIVVGLFLMTVSALTNAFTARLVLEAGHATGRKSYEGVAEAVGGRRWKVVTQVALVLLLFGTIVGDFALIADVSTRAVSKLSQPGQAPFWLVAGGGRGAMTVVALAIVFPLCLLRGMRQLETVATGGVVVIVAILVVVVRAAAQAGFPAVRDGALPWFGVPEFSKLPESFAIVNFAFYLHPMLMPLLHEMPAGRLGVTLTASAVDIVVLGVATTVYGIIGIFGAARYGHETQGDCLVNSWLGGKADGVLDAAMAVYLAISIPPMQLSLRYTLDCLIAGEGAQWSRQRQVLETVGIIGACLGTAALFPSYAEKIFAVTGATAVCLVCCVLPVLIHLRLTWKGAAPPATVAPAEIDAAQPLLSGLDQHTADQQKEGSRWQWCQQVLLPILVALLGTVLSGAALWFALRDLMRAQSS